MSANDKRIPHYWSEYQHWDLVIKLGMGYLDGVATKYLSRWRKKGGLEDLDKALHYIEKLYEVQDQLYKPPRTNVDYELELFSQANQLGAEEREAIRFIILWDRTNLNEARRIVRSIRYAAEQPTEHSPPLRDSDPVPASEENLHGERAPSSQPRARAGQHGPD